MEFDNAGHARKRKARPRCVLFADVCGSTRLYEALGDHVAAEIVGRCLGHMRAATTKFRGSVEETVGDAILATFSDPRLAVMAAGEMMRRVGLEPPVLDHPLAFRMGMHDGPVLPGDGQGICGDAVNTAARILSLAKRGQILASEALITHLPEEIRLGKCRPLHSVNLKGKRGETTIFEILWQDRGDITLMAPRHAVPVSKRCLILRHGRREFRLEGGMDAMSIGREAGNQIVIDDRRISRVHAKILARSGKFVVVDQSTNGTHVILADDTRYLLRMEELVVHGRGRINLINPEDDKRRVGLLEFEIF